MNVYMRIMDDLTSQVKGGRYKPGEMLPVIGELARDYRCSRRTVTHALELMAAARMISRVPGKSYAVCEKDGSTASPVMYVRIAADLRSQVADGTLKPGEQLPPRKTFMSKYGCGYRTVSTALALAESEGMIRFLGKRYYITPDDDQPDPRICVRMMDDIRGLVLDGRLTSGDQPPSVSVLAVVYECSIDTAKRAVRKLSSEGLVYFDPGRGYFVT